MQLSRPSLRGLCVALAVVVGVGGVAVPQVAAAPAKSSKKPKKPKNKAKQDAPAAAEAPAGDEAPDAGDGSIPEELEPGQVASGAKSGGGGGPGPSVGISSRKPNIGSDALAAEFDMEASAKFDQGQYVEAARLWVRALEALPENETNHITRAAILANAITAYEQIYVENGDVEVLKRAQLVISDYLRACKKRHASGCDRFPETADARERLKSLSARIDTAQPKINKVPPEIDTAPGGRPFNRMIKLPATPAWIPPTFVGGIALAGGGAGLMYFAATDSRFDAATTDTANAIKIDYRDADTTGGDTTDGSTDSGTTTDGSSSSNVSAIDLPPQVKGDIIFAFGAFMIAAGVGLVVLSSIKLAKHRRLNRERGAVLSIMPTFNRGGGGLGLSGRF